MIELSLKPKKGNINRLWNVKGYLGLTKVLVEGVVTTRFKIDQRPIKAKYVIVKLKCVEYSLNDQNILFEISQLIWGNSHSSNNGNSSYQNLGELETDFKLTIPKCNNMPSSTNLKSYKIVWKLEAVVKHEKMPWVGEYMTNNVHLQLHRYNHVYKQLNYFNQSVNGIEFYSNLNKLSFKPLDSLQAKVNLNVKDKDLKIRKLSMSLERRIINHNIKPSIFRNNIQITKLLEESKDVDNNDLTLTFNSIIPCNKSTLSWSIGESFESSLISINFFITFSLTFKSSKSIALNTYEINLLSVNQNQLYQANNHLLNSNLSKSVTISL